MRIEVDTGFRELDDNDALDGVTDQLREYHSVREPDEVIHENDKEKEEDGTSKITVDLRRW
jgi:hypothetical protein